MKGLKRFLQFLLILAAAAAAIVALLEILRRKDRQMDEMDAYLMNEDDDEIPQVVCAQPDEYLEQDLEEWKSLGFDQAVEVSFRLPSDEIHPFVDQIEEAGYPAFSYPDTGVVDVLVAGPKDQTEISALETVLRDAMKRTEGKYLGFAYR